MIQSERRKYQENDMRPSLRILAAVLTFGGGLAPALAAPVCLDTYRIQNTTIPNAHTIVFHMKDGSVWRNALRNACPDLKFWGFVYVDRGSLNQICGNQDAIKVINTGEICLLGSFTRETPVPPA
jgi:hypothetical protein